MVSKTQCQLGGKVEGQLTGMRSAYFWRMRSASALRFSKGCSSLNLDRILLVATRSSSAVFEVCCEGVLRRIGQLAKIGCGCEGCEEGCDDELDKAALSPRGIRSAK